MKALVIPAAGRVDLVDVREDSKGLPPRDYRYFRMDRPNGRVTLDTPAIPMVVSLLCHKVAGGELRGPVIAYWPSNWLDSWGVREVFKFFKIELKEEDYDGTDYIVVNGRDVVATDLAVRETVRMDIQRPQTSTSKEDQVSQRRLAIHSGHLLSDERGPEA